MNGEDLSTVSDLEHVVSSSCCVGCGGCSVATQGRIPVRVNLLGYKEAQLQGISAEDLKIGSSVCPFSSDSRDETEIADNIYPDLPSDFKVGKHRSVFAGRITNRTVEGSSSGGLTSWILSRLLRERKVDGVIHVGSTDSNPIIAYRVSHSEEEIADNRKSMYHSVSFNDAIESIRGNGKTYAVVAVPCFIRSLRNITASDQELQSQIKYYVGIVCGHMKSAGYAESLAWQQGITPEELGRVDFRVKDPSKSAKHYMFGGLKAGERDYRLSPPGTLVGANWGHAVFQLNACNYCDDIYAETADIVLGDAWLPKYEADRRGTNLVVTRSRELEEMLLEGLASGEVTLDRLDVEAAIEAQAGNYRHRHDGLAVRLADDDLAGRWRPRKRIKPDPNAVGRRRRGVIRERRQLSEASHTIFLEAKRRGSLEYYLSEIGTMINRYNRSSRLPLIKRIVRRGRREFWIVVRRLGKK